jgi:5'-deoxynucleotidase YfbR-like HD superfamily hydrolase
MFWEPLITTVTGDLNRLNSIWRYSSIPVCHDENDIEHLGWVCIYSLIIHDTLRPSDLHLIGPIATHAISHDVTESITGDIVRTFKYSSQKLRDAITEAEMGIISNFPESVRNLLGLHVRLLTSKGHEDEIDYVINVVKMADFLSLWMFMRRELMRSNREIVPFYMRMIDDLEQMYRKFLQPKDFMSLVEEKYNPTIAEFYQTLVNGARDIYKQFAPEYVLVHL